MSNIAASPHNVPLETPREVTAHSHDHPSHEGGHGHHGPANLLHHFTDIAQQRECNSLGMWVFLVTEVMTFGALFFVYTLYRHLFENQAHVLSTPDLVWLSPWGVGSHMLDNTLGFINTLVLLCSSLTVATAVYMAGIKQRKWLVGMLALTGVLGVIFLGIKAAEWKHDYDEGIVPGLNWNPKGYLAYKGFLLAEPTGVNGQAYVPGDAAMAKAHWQANLAEFKAHQAEHGSPASANHAEEKTITSAAEQSHDKSKKDPIFFGVVNGMQLQMFFVVYFCMTGLHALHMVIGLGLIAVFIFHASRGVFTIAEGHNEQPVEIFGLYWHFVDIVWIFLYPLLYLITLPHPPGH